MKNTVIVILLVAFSVGSFLFGWDASKRGVAKSVERMQAELSFAHLKVYRDIKSDFMSGCKPRVESRLEHAIDEQKMLMAEYVQSVSDESFKDYINMRDKGLIEELISYEVNWDKTWILPDCSK